MYFNRYGGRFIGKYRIWGFDMSSVFGYLLNMKGIGEYNVYNYNLCIRWWFFWRKYTYMFKILYNGIFEKFIVLLLIIYKELDRFIYIFLNLFVVV